MKISEARKKEFSEIRDSGIEKKLQKLFRDLTDIQKLSTQLSMLKFDFIEGEREF
jgi:hypothetical protein